MNKITVDQVYKEIIESQQSTIDSLLEVIKAQRELLESTLKTQTHTIINTGIDNYRHEDTAQ